MSSAERCTARADQDCTGCCVGRTCLLSKNNWLVEGRCTCTFPPPPPPWIRACAWPLSTFYQGTLVSLRSMTRTETCIGRHSNRGCLQSRAEATVYNSGMIIIRLAHTHKQCTGSKDLDPTHLDAAGRLLSSSKTASK